MMKKTLIEKVGWRRPNKDDLHGHYDCELKKTVGFVFSKLGFSDLDFELSQDIRESKLSREEAIKRLDRAKKELTGISRPFLKYEEFFGMSEADWLRRTKLLLKLRPAYRLMIKLSTPIITKMKKDPLLPKIYKLV